jgi:NADH dehydrogenase FAD-containing subunit
MLHCCAPQVAFQQADYVAWNVWAAMAGRPLLPFRYQHLGSMMSLGSSNAAVALPLPVPLPLQTTVQSSPLGPLLSTLGVKLSAGDPDGGVTLEGPLAALVRRAAYLYRQPTNEQRASVAADWLQQAARLASAALSGLQQGASNAAAQNRSS